MKRLLCALAIAACSKSSGGPAPAARKAPAASTAATPAGSGSAAIAGSGAPARAGHAHKHEDRDDPAIAKPPLTLAVRVDGAATTWHQDVFDRVPHFTSTNHGGEARETWSLRELAHAEVGPTARVVAVIGDTRQTIDPAAWRDPNRTPIVHRTRRGELKFRWADASGTWGKTVVKHVTGLELVR